MLEAHGGLLVKLQPIVAGGLVSPDAPPALESYRYTAVDHPADFVPNSAKLSKYNARPGLLTEADSAKGAPPRYAASMDDLLPHRNTCGIFALSSADPAAIEAARAAVLRAAKQVKPDFD